MYRVPFFQQSSAIRRQVAGVGSGWISIGGGIEAKPVGLASVEGWAGEIQGHDVGQHHSHQRRRTSLEVVRSVREERVNRRGRHAVTINEDRPC
jgi:hypothetical protein